MLTEDQLIYASFDIYSSLVSDEPRQWDVFVSVKPRRSKSWYTGTVVRFEQVGKTLREIKFTGGAGVGHRDTMVAMARGYLINFVNRQTRVR